jgi:hypothetical protein
MPNRTVRLVFTALIAGTLSVIAGAADVGPVDKFSTNAGTGPYLWDVQSGLGNVQFDGNRPTFALIYHTEKVLRQLLAIAARRVQTRLEPDFALPSTSAISILPVLAGQIAGLTLPDSPTLEGSRTDLVNKLRKIDIKNVNTVNAAMKAASAFVGMFEDVLATDSKGDFRPSPAEHYLSYKLGLFLGRNSTQQFGLLDLSLGEWGEKRAKVAAFLSASEQIPLGQEGSISVFRAGGGFAFGDPDRVIGCVSGASYLSPDALDVEASLSYRLCSAEKMARSRWEQKEEQRYLLDHIRASDLWASGSARWISDSRSGDLANGQIFEGCLTYAFPARQAETQTPFTSLDRSLIKTTTLSVSRIYCAQKALSVDEFGFEIRTPIGGLDAFQVPLYFSARYGTRDHFTFALEGRF